MTEEKRKAFKYSVTVQRDPGAYERYLHNRARYEEYGSGEHMELNMQPPAPEQVVKFEFSTEQCRVLADIFHEMIENGTFVLEGDENVPDRVNGGAAV